MGVRILYDGDCPFCQRYVGMLRLRESAGRVELVDMREDRAAREAVVAEGFDPDLGMVAEIDGARYGGDAALSALALLTTPSGWFNRLTLALFRNPGVARVAYPFLRAGRNLTITLLGKAPILAEDAGMMAKFRLFASMIALFSLYHIVLYLDGFAVAPSWDLALVGIAGAAVFLRPGSVRLFLVLMAVSAVSAWVKAPLQSNHTMLFNVVLLAFLLVYAYNLLRGSRWSQTFADFSAAGGSALLVMYVFGIFHKINTGFLDPEISCANALWADMPPPFVWLQGPITEQATIWATFVVEGAVLVALLTRSLRHIGVVVGIVFHLFLALTDYLMFVPFSMLSISLHLLFLSPGAAARVAAHPAAAWVLEVGRHPVRIGLAAGSVGLAMLLAEADLYMLVSFTAFVFLVPISWAAIVAGAERPGERWSLTGGGKALTGLVAAAFFVSCLTPYMGLRTAQSMNMFANLRVEGGVSNHLVFADPPSLFPYTADLVEITDAEGSFTLERAVAEGWLYPWYQVLAELADNPGARASVVRGGVALEDQTAETLAAEIEAVLHPAWVRKWLHFRPVRPEIPPRCF